MTTDELWFPAVMLGILIAMLNIFDVPWPVLAVLFAVQLVIFGRYIVYLVWRR